MIYLKDKAVKPYLGNYKPLNIYKGNTKIVGWKNSTKTGVNSVTLENTYNANMGVKVTGKATQVQTVQGKNLFNEMTETKNYTINLTTGNVDYPASNRNTSDYIEVIEDSYYYCNVIMTRVAYYDENKNFVVSKTTISNDKVPLGCKYIIFSYYNGSNNIIFSKDTLLTPYEPFIPNSPSPDYPSEIQTSNLSEIKVEPINLWKQPRDLDLRDIKSGHAQPYVVNDLITLYQYGDWNNLGAYFKENSIIIDTDKTELAVISLRNLKPNTEYTLSYFLETNATLSLYRTMFAKGTVKVANFNEQFFVNFITNENGEYGHYRENDYHLIWLNLGERPEIKYKDVILVEGTYTLETMPKFVPYFQPLTYPITPTNGFPSLPNGIADTIEVVDGVQSYVQRVGKVDYTMGLVIYNDPSCFAIGVATMGLPNASLWSQYVISNLFKYSTVIRVGNSSRTLWIYKSQIPQFVDYTAEQFKQFLIDNEFVAYYPLATPIITPIEQMKTLPQSCSINLQADMGLDLEVSYKEMEM